MANADKGKYVVLFNSGNFVFFKHKNDKVSLKLKVKARIVAERSLSELSYQSQKRPEFES